MTKEKRINLNDPHSTLEHYCFMMHQFFTVRVLHIMRFYSNNTYSIFMNHEAWVEHFVSQHLNLPLMEARIGLGFKFWRDMGNTKMANAEMDAYHNFGLVGLVDITKASPYEVGCYDMYTFAVDKELQGYEDALYERGKRSLVEFIASTEGFFIKMMTQNPHYAIKTKLCNATPANEEQRINTWIDHQEYAHSLFTGYQNDTPHLSVIH